MKPKYQLNSLINAYIEGCNALITGQISGISVVENTNGGYAFNYRVSFDNTFDFVDEADIFSTYATISFENGKVIITDKENKKEYKYND